MPFHIDILSASDQKSMISHQQLRRYLQFGSKDGESWAMICHHRGSYFQIRIYTFFLPHIKNEVAQLCFLHSL